jgi:hypothetical protein
MAELTTPVSDPAAPRRHPGIGLTVFLGIVTFGVMLVRVVQGGFLDLDCQKQLVSRSHEVFNVVLWAVLGAAPVVFGLARGIVRRRWRWPWVVLLGLHVWLTVEYLDFIGACPNW